MATPVLPRTDVPRTDVAGSVLRLCSVFEPHADALRRVDAAAYDPIGGMQNHAGALTRGLDRLGVRQHVVTSRLGGPRSRQRLGQAATVVRTGVGTRHARQLWALDALAPRALPRDIGLVHAHQGEDLAVLPLAEALARRAGCPLVVTVHCSVRRTLDRSRRRPLTVLGPAVEARGLRRADAVLVLTSSAAAALAEDGIPEDRVHVVPSGFDPVLFGQGCDDPTPHVPRPRVLFAGRMHPQKRPLDAVSAHALLDPDVHLVLVGDGPLLPSVTEAATRSPARERIHVVGLEAHARIPAHLQHADAFVLPSHYEELGTAVVEAMAAGVPVAAYRTGGIPEIVDDGVTGRLAERGDVAGLAAALRDLVRDGAAVARHARQQVQHTYAWPVLTRRVHDVYVGVQRG
jgi:glycogen(starch) synthase